MTSLHDSDLLAWSEEQTEILRRGDFGSLDIDNIIEELDAVGKSDQHALYSYLVVLITHLLKKEYQPDMISNSWIRSISNSRGGIAKILKRNPSYTRFLHEDIDDAFKIARKNAILETGLKPEIFPKINFYDHDVLLTDED